MTNRPLALAAVFVSALALLPGTVEAYDLRFRQNQVQYSADELRGIFDHGMPADFDKTFPEQQWSIWLLVDAHPDKGQVAVTLGLCPRLGDNRVLLPTATYSVIEPLPAGKEQLADLLAKTANTFGSLMVQNSQQVLRNRQ